MTPAEWREAVAGALSNAIGAGISYGEAAPGTASLRLRALLVAEDECKRFIWMAADVFTKPENVDTSTGCIDGSDR